MTGYFMFNTVKMLKKIQFGCVFPLKAYVKHLLESQRDSRYLLYTYVCIHSRRFIMAVKF